MVIARYPRDLHAGERSTDAVVASDPEDQLRLRQPARHAEAIRVRGHVGVGAREGVLVASTAQEGLIRHRGRFARPSAP
jgi:hypothetical protein